MDETASSSTVVEGQLMDETADSSTAPTAPMDETADSSIRMLALMRFTNRVEWLLPDRFEQPS